MAYLSTVVDFLNNEGVGHEIDETGDTVRFSFSGDTGTWMIFVHTLEESGRVAVLSIVPSLAPESVRDEVGRFLHRSNFGLVVGNFEIDMDGGEVRFRTSMDLDDLELTTAMVRNLIFGNIAVVNDYLPGLNRVIHGGLSADEAIQLLEDSQPERASENEG